MRIASTLSLVAVLYCPTLGFHVSYIPLRITTFLSAKSPPTDAFDLAAIEALEAELDRVDDAADDWSEEEALDGPLSTFEITLELDNKRIDAALAILTDLSRSACGKLVDDGHVAVDDKITKRKSVKVTQGQVLQVTLPQEEPPSMLLAEDLPLDILFEDEHMMVINKAAGMVVHPAVGNWNGTVVNAIAGYLSKSAHGAGEFYDMTVDQRPGIVHRLDKGTTGILVVAKTASALAALSASFAARQVKKMYLAITVGNPGTRVIIDKPVGRHPVHRQRMRVVPESRSLETAQVGRRALSYVDTLTTDGKLSLCRVRIATGRTHQIRVHLQDRHTPIYGDDVYGLPDWNKRLKKTHQIARPLLHAFGLEVDHPVTGEKMVLEAPMPEDMQRIVRTIDPEFSI